MKSFENIYLACKDRFYNDSKIDMAKGSVIDMIFKSFSYMLSVAHKEIEDNKKPYLFTKQTGDELDNTGEFLQCSRLPNESDENYKYRLMKWTQRNASGNLEAINEAIKTLSFSSSATYVPYTDGVGTATVYLIPYKYEEDFIKNAISEASEVIGKVISPASIIEYTVPTPKKVKLVAYLDVKQGSDINYIKREIITKVKDYINTLAPGSNLMLGAINNIGLNVDGVEYFNIIQVYLDDKESTAFEILQTVTTKMLFEEIVWWEVES